MCVFMRARDLCTRAFVGVKVSGVYQCAQRYQIIVILTLDRVKCEFRLQCCVCVPCACIHLDFLAFALVSPALVQAVTLLL